MLVMTSMVLYIHGNGNNIVLSDQQLVISPILIAKQV